MLCQSPEPVSSLTDRLNQLLGSGGDRDALSLCPGQQYHITRRLAFAAQNQEIATLGYPTVEEREAVVVAGP